MKIKTLLLAVFACLFSTCLFSQEKGKLIYTDFEPDSSWDGWVWQWFGCDCDGGDEPGRYAW